MFVDLAGFTALTESHGDEAAVALVNRFLRLSRGAVGDRGTVVKLIGDAVLLHFEQPAAALQSVSELFVASSFEPNFPELRAGLHRGPAEQVDGDYFGTTVNIAARVAGVARSGQLLLTDAAISRVYEHRLTSIGAVELRHVRESQSLYELVWSDDRSLIDPVCKMRLEPDKPAERLWHASREYWFCSLACTAVFATQPERYPDPMPVTALETT